MHSFTARRIRNGSLTLLSIAGVAWWVNARQQHLGSTAHATGYLLLAAVLFLAGYNLRKKLPFLPIGSSATWLQWHLYIATGTLGVFVLHAGWWWPNGILESTLAAAYLLTMASGFLGLYLTRTIPGQLARVGMEVLQERIPAFRTHTRRRAEEVVLESVAATGATTLADFYANRLYDYFARPRGLRYFLRPTTARRRALMREMQDVCRYLTEQEQAAAERLFKLVRRKDDLDFHDARQKLLKTWLFAHIGLTCVLVVLGLLHSLLAHAFAGGAA